ENSSLWLYPLRSIVAQEKESSPIFPDVYLAYNLKIPISFFLFYVSCVFGMTRRHVILISEERSSPPMTTKMSKHAERRKVGEVAGGAAAECAAVCCCCPCAVVNLVVLAVYKVPAAVCKKAWKRSKRRRFMMKRHGLLASSAAKGRESTVHARLKEEDLTAEIVVIEKNEANCELNDVIMLEDEMFLEKPLAEGYGVIGKILNSVKAGPLGVPNNRHLRKEQLGSPYVAACDSTANQMLSLSFVAIKPNGFWFAFSTSSSSHLNFFVSVDFRRLCHLGDRRLSRRLSRLEARRLSRRLGRHLSRLDSRSLSCRLYSRISRVESRRLSRHLSRRLSRLDSRRLSRRLSRVDSRRLSRIWSEISSRSPYR
ncbi:hypothetical protein HID58_062366, partial [Brassica napus]